MACASCQQARQALWKAAKAAIRGNPGETVSYIHNAAVQVTQARSESERIRAITRRST